MTVYEKIKSMGLVEMAEAVMKTDISTYCKADCLGDFESEDLEEICPHELSCCIKWLGGECNEKI